MATPSTATLFFLCLLSLSTHATSSTPSSLRRGLLQMASSKGDFITIPVPKSAQEASRQMASRGKPSDTDVSFFTTLPEIDANGNEVPRETLKVSFTNTGKRIVERVPQKTDSSASQSPPFLPLQSIIYMTSCNVAPPPFRILPGFEETKNLPNGVVSLLFYRWYLGWNLVKSCSGWLAHPKRVITSASCVYDHYTRRFFWDDSLALDIMIGLNGYGEGDTYTRTSLSAVTTDKKFTNYSKWSQSLIDGTDTAVLWLATPAEAKTYGWSSPKQGLARMILGYPGFRQYELIGDIIRNPNSPLRYGCVNGTGGNILCEDLSTQQGSQGSPLFSALNSDVVVGTFSARLKESCPSLFTLAVPRTSSASSLTALLQIARCRVSLSGGVSRATSCEDFS